MTARDVVLDRIRRALGPTPHVPTIPRDYRVVADLDPADVVDRFATRVDDYHATVHRTTSDGLAATLASVLDRAGARRIVVPSGLADGWLAGLSDDLDVQVDDPPVPTGELDAFDAVVTGVAVGIAETGTVVLDGSADQGRRAITLVPDHHVCVVTADRIVQTVPEGLARLDPTRPLTMISGPSATSDIELDRVEGVHGPRILDVIVSDT